MRVRLYHLFYPRIALSFVALFFLVLIALFFLASLGIIGIAFQKLGFPPEYSILLLLLSLIGSYVNIPVKRIESRTRVVSGVAIDFYGLRYIIPPLQVKQSTVIAINLGGAIIPVIVSVLLIPRANPIDVLFGVSVMSILIHMIARPVRGLGIAVPALLPPLMSAAIALILSPQQAPIIAYISGTLGSLIGADLLNLKKIPELGTPVASIGGAGTFDGIFLTGIISVLLA